MLTPLSITSLDQGRELARREVARLYAEPAEAAAEVPVGISEAVPETHAVARRSACQVLFGWIMPIRQPGYFARSRHS